MRHRPSEMFQYALEALTLGAWNPRLIWVSSNRPLWFMSVLLFFHYTAPYFLPLIKNVENVGVLSLLVLFIVLYLTRLGIAALTVLEMHDPGKFDGHRRLIHMWMPTQMFLPFMGSILQQFVARLDIPEWISRLHVRFLADASL